MPYSSLMPSQILTQVWVWRPKEALERGIWGDESKPSNLGTFTGMNAKKKNNKKKKTKEKKKKKHKMKHHHQLAETRV